MPKIDAGLLLQMVQAADVINGMIRGYAEGTLTPAQVEERWDQVHSRARAARAAWQQAGEMVPPEADQPA